MRVSRFAEPSARVERVALGAALLIGVTAWIICYASQPRYATTETTDMGNPIFFPVLALLALGGGYLSVARPGLIGLALGFPALILSPWTTPRGDNSGLWALLLPMLLIFVMVLPLIDHSGQILRGILTRRANRQP